MAYSLRFTKRRNLVATPQQSNDVYIVEYPKSGITWLTTILANLALRSSGIDNYAVTFANLRLIIPDIHHGQELSAPPYSHPPIRFIKSHSTFTSHYKFAIYLVRHPVKVANSYYRYMVARGHIQTDFSTYVRDPKIGIRSWRNHIDSWLSGSPKGGILHLIRYEDLVDDATVQIAELCANLGWQVTNEMIEDAVNKSAAERMKISEERFLAHDPRYRSGFVKSEAFALSEADQQYILDTCASQIELLGYKGNSA